MNGEIEKLTGEGLCECAECRRTKGWNRIWTSWCYRYKGEILCADCLQKILEKEQKNGRQTERTIL